MTTLTDLLAKQVYPQLMMSKMAYKENGRDLLLEYKSLLVGGKPNRDLCRKAAEKAVKMLSDSGGVREFGSRQAVKAEPWSGPLCRGLSAVGRGREDGPWWFEAELVQRWEKVYAAETAVERRAKVMESLRPMLAVCRDWNDMVRLVTMTPGAPAIPVLTGQGAHQPIDSHELGTETDSPEEKARKREAIKVWFIGGFQQVYVPFVPAQLIRPYV